MFLVGPNKKNSNTLIKKLIINQVYNVISAKSHSTHSKN